MTARHRGIVFWSCSSALFSLVVLGGVGSIGSDETAAQAQSSRSEPAAANTKIARGRYLVHHVAQCIQCHTPRDDDGNLMASQLLTGATIPVAGPRYAQPWAAHSAWIAGLGSYDEAFVHYLLTHGHKPDGSRPKSPMPSFKMTGADADAVIAYLRTL